MEKEKILAIFDENRRNPGKNWEILPFVTRSISSQNGFLGVYHSCFPQENLEEGILSQIEYFSSLNLDFEWKVYEHDSPHCLRERLIFHGFSQGEAESFLVRELSSWKNQEKKLSPSCEIKKCEGMTLFEDYEKVVWDVHQRKVSSRIQYRMEHEPHKISIYIFYKDGKPVSIGRIDDDDEHPLFVHLGGGATLQEYRGQGFYSALVQARMKEAQERNKIYAYSDALPLSEPILRKFGFEKLSTTYPMCYDFEKN